MLRKCEKTGIYFKGKRLIKGEIIEVDENVNLGNYEGLFTKIGNNDIKIYEKNIINKPKKRGKK